MKKIFCFAGLCLVYMATLQVAYSQTLSSGIIHYEVMRKIDLSQMRIVVNGEQVQPGSPEAPDVPDVNSFAQKLLFSGTYAKEAQESEGPVIRRMEGGGAPTTIKLNPPFTEKIHLDLAAKKYIETLETKKDTVTKRYRAEVPFHPATGWQDADKTKKIAGYTCRKATCPYKGETYTLWYTTELPFTYSPVHELLPPKGVVLELEGSGESFRATKVEAKAISENEVKPTQQGQLVSPQELEQVRKKAQADFRQRMFSGELEQR